MFVLKLSGIQLLLFLHCIASKILKMRNIYKENNKTKTLKKNKELKVYFFGT